MNAKTGVVYLLKDRLQVYSPYLGSIIEFRFVPEIVRDLDIINKNLLESLIKVFVTNGKIAPINLIFVLADNTYFAKDFVIPAQPVNPKSPQSPQPQLNVSMESLHEAADKYIEHVPYDNVVSRSFPLKDGFRICAANQDFYESIKNAFEKLGFSVPLVVPGLVLGGNASAKPIMDGAMAMSVLQRASAFKQFDFLNQQIYAPTQNANEGGDDVEVEQAPSKKTDKKRLFMMVGILASLIILLVIVYVQSQTPPTPPQQPAQASSPVSAVKQASTVNAAVPTVLTPAPVVPTVASGLAKTLSVQIVNASASALAAQSLRSDLVKDEFKTVTIQSQSTIGSSTTIVSFSPTIDQSIRNMVLDAVRKYKTDITVQERQNAVTDISIIFGN